MALLRFVFKGNNSGNPAAKHGLTARKKNNGSVGDAVNIFSEININPQKPSQRQDPVAAKETNTLQKR
jgi:hypothetical protein